MKRTKIVIVISAIFVFMASIAAFAQEESGEDLVSNGFKKLNVREDFTENAMGTHSPDRICGRERLHQGIYGQGRILYRDGL